MCGLTVAVLIVVGCCLLCGCRRLQLEDANVERFFPLVFEFAAPTCRQCIVLCGCRFLLPAGRQINGAASSPSRVLNVLTSTSGLEYVR